MSLRRRRRALPGMQRAARRRPTPDAERLQTGGRQERSAALTDFAILVLPSLHESQATLPQLRLSLKSRLKEALIFRCLAVVAGKPFEQLPLFYIRRRAGYQIAFYGFAKQPFDSGLEVLHGQAPPLRC